MLLIVRAQDIVGLARNFIDIVGPLHTVNRKANLCGIVMRMSKIQQVPVMIKNICMACAFIIVLSACAAGGGASQSKISSAHVQHLVFVTLANPNDAAAMKADSDALLPKIPGVLNYACGPHIDVGRKSIRQDYTLGILVEFANVDAYRAYQANPDHVALIKKWKPKWSKSEMFDFGAP